MARLCLLLATIFIASDASASDYCDGYQRGYESIIGYSKGCVYKPHRGIGTPSDYEHGFAMGVQEAVADQKKRDSRPNSQQRDCDCSRLATFDLARQPRVWDKTPKQRQKEAELEELRRQAEIEALNAQIRLSKSQGASSSAQRKATATQKSEHDRQKKQVKDKLDNSSKLIQQLASGGSQEKRQANFDKTMIAYLDAMQTYQKFYDEWTVPKYTK